MKNAKKLVYCATFAALCCLATFLLAFPFPGGIGYFNVGDVIVLLAGWFLGPWLGGVAAGVGSVLADVMAGYALYAPATLLIKGGVAIIGYFLWRLFRFFVKKEGLDFLFRILAAVVAELFMVAGYFLYESILYGMAGAAGSVVGNLTQGAVGAACAVLLVLSLRPIPFVKKSFTKLY